MFMECLVAGIIHPALGSQTLTAMADATLPSLTADAVLHPDKRDRGDSVESAACPTAVPVVEKKKRGRGESVDLVPSGSSQESSDFACGSVGLEGSTEKPYETESFESRKKRVGDTVVAVGSMVVTHGITHVFCNSESLWPAVAVERFKLLQKRFTNIPKRTKYSVTYKVEAYDSDGK